MRPTSGVLLGLAFACTRSATAQAPDSLKFSEVINGTIAHVTYSGRRAIRLTPPATNPDMIDEMFAVIANTELQDGSIDVDVAGTPSAGAPEGARGFIGVAFRVAPRAEHAEAIYIRPTNGRADDQLRRNHSTQYISEPGYPWYKLRQESPGQYESYVDLEPGVWTHLRIVVAGKTAKLFVNDAPQPCLIVNDLKQGVTSGLVALWANVNTDAYFGTVRIQKAQ